MPLKSIRGWLGLENRADDGTDLSVLRATLDALDHLPPDRAQLLGAFAYLLGRVAHADEHVSAEETSVMEQLVREHGAIPAEEAAIVVHLAQANNRLFGGTSHFLVARAFAAMASYDEKLALMRCLFAVAATDETISMSEEAEIHRIANELRVERATSCGSASHIVVTCPASPVRPASRPRELRKLYGQARVRHEPVPGRLRRPYGVCAKSRRSSATSSKRLRGKRAVSTVAACTTSCVTGTTIILNGSAAERAFAAAWRNQPKWVVSRSLKSVGPNARLVENDLEGAIRKLKTDRDGEIEVAGPDLAKSLTELGLIDEYRIYLHPVVLGAGKPYFAGPGHRSASYPVIGLRM